LCSIEHQMTEIYCFIDDYFKAHPRRAGWRRSPNYKPAFTDSEVITIALLQGSFGCATLKEAYLLVRANWRAAFPRLCSYKQWLNRPHSLTSLIGQLVEATRHSDFHETRLYLMDAKPIPVCKPIRHGRVRLLREDGAYFGKSTTGWFFGFKLHVITRHSGEILCGALSSANTNERDVAVALSEAVDGGIVLCDGGYRSAPLACSMAEEAELLLITPQESGERRALVSSLRQRVETTFSQLWARFVGRIFSRSWHGLWNTIKLKMLHYNLSQAGLLSA
jgi:Transposase DDE domain